MRNQVFTDPTTYLHDEDFAQIGRDSSLHKHLVEDMINDTKIYTKMSDWLKDEYPTIYEGYKQIMDEQFELFCSKHADYGMSNISQGTSLETADERKFALSGLFFRLNDKVNRWKNLLMNNRVANNEALIDTYKDITNYAIIAQLVERGLWKK
jgi:hypothetical protein